jgi:hypothetical protein
VNAPVNNKKNNAANAPAANAPVNNKKNNAANAANATPAANAPANAPKTGGKRHRKRRGGMASLKAFDAVHTQPSDAVMQRATTAGGSRKRRSQKRRSQKRRQRRSLRK